jgi:rhodanese-related sulfurtransferase
MKQQSNKRLHYNFTMRNSFLLSFALPCLILIAAGCSGSNKKSPAVAEESRSSTAVVTVGQETSLLIQDLKDMGDYVNGREFPSLIKASVVNESMDQNIHIIDLRDQSKFVEGHIKGSVNKKFEDLPEYFETGIKPFEFDKIVLVCEDGQISSYTASLLRLMGYGNVFAMRWGMSSWNTHFAEDEWLNGLSGKYESQLERTSKEKPAPGKMPELNTGLTNGQEISAARFNSVFDDGLENVMISSDEVFANPSNYFVIDYERKDKYEDGHIPGAVRYKPNATLGFPEEMGTIPPDKTVVVYCGTGHNSAFATAYLRLLGYDARTLKYGNNGFMYEWMKKDAAGLSWLPFDKSEINNFEVIK